MNEDILKGKWNQLKGEVKMRWGDLTDDELDMIEGRRDKLVGKLQERYGYTKDRAEREIESFINESGHH
ncbi:MAG TPA: CsbD family protein [Bacteroidales bacterium]|nr:CsbD family protein [Bacteroidales bacterium]